MVYAIETDGKELDQVCYSDAQAKKEKKDLERMGCTVKIRKFETETELHNHYDKV